MYILPIYILRNVCYNIDTVKETADTPERDAWEKEFNDIYNEGGEGFVPHYISIEELSEMKNRLKELKSKLEHLRIG